MTLPFFYIAKYDISQKELTLDEDTSRHIIQVLRMKTGEQLNLTDGKDSLLTCEITNEHKKHCSVAVRSRIQNTKSKISVSIAISLLKNTDRFEWFLEKATEIGIAEIIPLICERTEKEKFRYDRMQGICISAMLQSQQCWLPVLHEPMQFEKYVMNSTGHSVKLVAHCLEKEKQSISQFPSSQFPNPVILIGPEGDFTPQEIELAIQHQYIPVTLGETRLRTETAGVVAAVLLNQR